MPDTKLSLNPTLVAPLEGAPLYRALAERIVEAVGTGALAPGEQLPPVRNLAFALGIGPGAVARAYRIATERGCLEATVGRGTFVIDASRPVSRLGALLEPIEPPTPGRGAMPVARPGTGAGATVGAGTRHAHDAVAEPGVVDLRGNQAVDVGQAPALGAALQAVLDEHGGQPPLLSYRRRSDDMGLTRTLSDWLVAGGVPAEAERLIVVGGAQSGAVAALAALTRGGSGIVLTPPTLHPGLIDGLTTLGIRLEPVAADWEGVLPDTLDATIRRVRPDAALLSPTLQNPTLALAGPARRREVAAVLEHHGLPVVEDDVYGRLIQPRPESYAHLLPELCWYVASMSKCVAAGLRAGFVLTPPGRTISTLRAYQALVHQTPWLVLAVAAKLAETGVAREIEARVVQETGARAARAAAQLGAFGARTHPAASFAYLPLPAPWGTAAFVTAAAARGVLVAPHTLYEVGRIDQPFVRVALGARNLGQRLDGALARLAALLAEGPHLSEVAT
ncbi:MAG: PLP-dependent aminotransferase family protein [Pseudomonadota bacterium]